MMEPKHSRFEALVLPAIIAQSMIIGGGYSTGREIVEYTGQFGPPAWLGVTIIFGGFALIAALAFELARVGQAYDYKNWIRLLIGPLWPLFDLLGVVMILLTIAVMSAATGSVLETTLGLNQWVGLSLVFVMVGMLTWRGTAYIERFKTVGSVGLYLAYVGYAVLVLTRVEAPNVDPGTLPVASTAQIVVKAVQYVGYNISVFPAVLFCLYRQTSRKQAISSGVLAGVLMTLPLALTFLCLLRFWPDESVVGKETAIPWLPMLETAAGDSAKWWIIVFGAVAGWTLLETAVGSIHALVDRLERNLDDIPKFLRPRDGTFQPRQRAMISVGVLMLAVSLAPIGIVDLIAQGYGALAWGYIVLMALPLFTIGVWRIVRHDDNRQPTTDNRQPTTDN